MHSGSHTSFTVLLDAQGHGYKVCSPGETIALDFKVLLEITSGLPTASAPEGFEHIVAKGGVFVLHTDCYSTTSDAEDAAGGKIFHLISEEQLLLEEPKWCVATSTWADNVFFQHGSTERNRLTWATGMTVVTKFGGGFARCPNINRIVSSLTSALVLLALLSQLCMHSS